MSGYGSFSSLQLIKEIDMMAISCDDKIDTFYGYQCHIAVIIYGVSYFSWQVGYIVAYEVDQ